MAARTIVLSAGGTGGHLFPAEALAHELNNRGWTIRLATDDRAERFAVKFPADQTHIIRSATFASKKPVAILKTVWELYRGYREARQLYRQFKPSIVVGFGGYPTIPPLVAANRMGIVTLIQEQNAILGRANRLLSSAAKAIAVGFAQVGDDQQLASKIVVTGNPLRPPVMEAAKRSYEQAELGGVFKLLIFAGSQGARFFSECLPQTVALLPEEYRQRLRVVQQARPEDLDAVIANYRQQNFSAEVAPFFDHLPDRIADAHLVISRAGASSVGEIMAIGRPSILVPLPHSLDGDQAANAADLAARGGATIVRQSELSAEKLCAMLVDAMNNPESLATTAKNAKKAAKPDAARHLADLVERIAAG